MSLHDLSIEQAVLGACMISPRWMPDTLRAEHFYAPEHGALWEEMRLRQRDGRLIDFVALKPWAMNHPALSKLGANGTYLLKLGEMGVEASTSAHVASYGEMLRDMARRRAVVEVAKGAIATAEKGEQDALPALEQSLQEIAANDTDADAWERAGVDSCEAIERAELGEARGISTGFTRLDDVTGGLQPGTLWVLGGATSMGKSIMGAAISRNIAAQGYGVGEIHLEMDRIQIGLRQATALAFENSHRADNPTYLAAQRGNLRPDQWSALRGAAKAAASLPIYVDARPGRSLSQIEAAARRLFRKMIREGVKPGALLIDHEGLIAAEAGARHPNQLERTNARSEQLLAMAKRLNVCVIALSQITKEGSRADGEDRLPNATDLNYGGAISQAATVVALIHRRAYYAERKPKHLRSEEDVMAIRSRNATLVVDKARGGQRAHVELWMDVPTAAVWENVG